MKKYKLVLFLSVLIYSCNIISQNDNWSLSTIANLEDKVTTTKENISYFVDPKMNKAERDEFIKTTTGYIKQNLAIINESEICMLATK